MTAEGERKPAPTLARIRDRVRAAAADGQPLDIVGGGSKRHLAAGIAGDTLEVSAHRGVVAHEPSELVITASAGTPLAVVEQSLAAHGQMLGFEPPRLGEASTIGGVIASGLSGPARPWRGSARDAVLGVELINGRGEVLRFGGQVMKNVAGYDVSRLVCGAWGTLGVISEVSLRVVPMPAVTLTLEWDQSASESAAHARALARSPWPITAMAWNAETLHVRIAGSREAIDDAVRRLAPTRVVDEQRYWSQLRDLAEPLPVPGAGEVLWRLSLPPAATDPHAAIVLWDWGGAQRWLLGSGADAAALRAYCSDCGGHAIAVRGAAQANIDVFQAPAAAEAALMKRVRLAFDPQQIFNRGRYG